MQVLTEKHNLISETKFHLKSAVLIIKRQLQNVFSNYKKFSDKGQLKTRPIISLSESDLWSNDDNEQNWLLTAGKIQNLRLASKKLNGIEVPVGQIFSFWKHIGNPNLGKGYVVGREIREGCIVPTIAGGLCQLSNALYDAAIKANFEIIERHRHTKVIKGSLAEQDRDATVKWNYIDLRFRSDNAFKIEIDITTDKLVVKFRSVKKNGSSLDTTSKVLLQSSKLNDCYSCGNFECFKYPDNIKIKKQATVTTFILDEYWSEYDDYIRSIATNTDLFIIPIYKNIFFKSDQDKWTIKNQQKLSTTFFAAIKRGLKLRLYLRAKKNVFSSMLQLDKEIAKALAKQISIESTHLVISQNLLPFLWQEGVLGGRTFDVLMNRLPIEKIHQRLDKAHESFPQSKTLNDFRASQTLIDIENIALTRARKIITPHEEIANVFINKSLKLNWSLPKQHKEQNKRGNKILFPASALGRKGAYEIRQLAKELDLTVVIVGKAIENNFSWEGVTIESIGANPFDGIQLVIYPAYIEHQPRLLLKALSMGIPVITTTACGLSSADNLTIIPIGDYDALKKAVLEQIQK